MKIFKNKYVFIEKFSKHYTMTITDYKLYNNFWNTIIELLNVDNKKYNNDKEYVIKFNCNNIESLSNKCNFIRVNNQLNKIYDKFDK